MNEYSDCPHCGESMQGEPIPQEYIDKGWYGDSTHYGRAIMHEIRGVYDGGLFFSCPDCGGRWHRWPEGHHLRERAEQYVNPPAVAEVAS